MVRCHNCGQTLIEIDNHGQRLTGCLSCNLWSAKRASGGRGSPRKTCERCISCGMAER